mmetsp:Transcript_13007/g.25243  ORF Transcript_13007/g.25243 Transcript_13007/m.25243 type:complete len:440 (+) Transcript_13007:78-1397(+)
MEADNGDTRSIGLLSPGWTVAEVPFRDDDASIEDDGETGSSKLFRSESWDASIVYGITKLDEAGEISALEVSVDCIEVQGYDSDSEVFLEQLNMLSLNDHDNDNELLESHFHANIEAASRTQPKGISNKLESVKEDPFTTSRPHGQQKLNKKKEEKAPIAVLNPFMDPMRVHFPPWEEVFAEIVYEDDPEDLIKSSGDLDMSIDLLSALNPEGLENATPVKCINPPLMRKEHFALALESNAPIAHLRTPFIDKVPASATKRGQIGNRRPLPALRKGMDTPSTPGAFLLPDSPTHHKDTNHLCMADLYSQALTTDVSLWPTPISHNDRSDRRNLERSPASFMSDASPIRMTIPSPSPFKYSSMSGGDTTNSMPSPLSLRSTPTSPNSPRGPLSSSDSATQWSTPVGERAGAIVSSVESCLGRQLKHTPARRYPRDLASPW